VDANHKSADAVRSFYERLPYPPPLTDLQRHVELYRNPQRRRAQFHLVFPTDRPRAGQRILVAGCGTSQAAVIALREPDAQVTGIDISEKSLNHTRALQQRYALANLDLRRLSILDVQALDRTFDLIICTGVLHHLDDPDLGLRSLRSTLGPDGAMQIMAYAAYGRAGIAMMRAYCRLLGVTPSPRDLEDLAAVLDALPMNHPLSHLLRMVKDFKHPDALADALLHPQERAYTVPQVYEWLDRCGMSFGRWYEQAPYLPQCGMLEKIAHAARLDALPVAAQHAAVELLRGTITRHHFIAYRSDRSPASQPISFAGEHWRNYVPIRLPWTVCLRDRVPPGSAAVLVNRAHEHSDLALPISAAQAQLLGLIDGKRTVDEIVRNGGTKDAELRGLRFFRQLWQYDQIAFDASGTSMKACVAADR
jgi:SAM-dependent methyltransferase